MSSSEHVVSIRVYVGIFALLLLLTVTTTAVAFVDLGALNNVAMLGIAVTKATLVVLYFMHVRYSTALTRLVICGACGWLALLIVGATLDMIVRGAPFLR